MNHRINKKVQFLNLGRTDYKECWDFQSEIFEEIVAIKIRNRNLAESEQLETPNYLIFCEHPHVYTLGKSGDPANLLVDEDELKKLEAEYFPINRGGDITYHGPGQLVGYPILDLENFFTDIHKYLRLLEESVIKTLADYGVAAGRVAGLTGVWIDDDKPEARKICALGVKSSRWVTMHGFAFNVNTDLKYFKNIVPCGIEDRAVTSLQAELGKVIDLDEVSALLKRNLAEVFQMNIIPKMAESNRRKV